MIFPRCASVKLVDECILVRALPTGNKLVSLPEQSSTLGLSCSGQANRQPRKTRDLKYHRSIIPETMPSRWLPLEGFSGLQTVYRIVKQSGGQVLVSSGP